MKRNSKGKERGVNRNKVVSDYSAIYWANYLLVKDKAGRYAPLAWSDGIALHSASADAARMRNEEIDAARV